MRETCLLDSIEPVVWDRLVAAALALASSLTLCLEILGSSAASVC